MGLTYVDVVFACGRDSATPIEGSLIKQKGHGNIQNIIANISKCVQNSCKDLLFETTARTIAKVLIDDANEELLVAPR